MENSVDKSFGADVLKYLPVKILPALSSLLTIFIVIRILTKQQYIDYSFILAVLLLFVQLTGGWINSTVMFFQPEFEKSNFEEQFKASIIFLQCMFVLFGLIGAMLAIFIGVESAVISLLSGSILVFQVSLNLQYSFFQSQRQILAQISSTLIQSITQICGVILCYFFFQNSLLSILLTLNISYLFAFGSAVHFSKYKFFTSYAVETKYLKKILEYGMPVCLWFFCTQFYSIGDRILLKYFEITYLVGNYISFRDLAVGLSGFISMPILMAAHPIILRLSKDKLYKSNIEKLLEKNIKLLILIFTPCFILIFFYGEVLLQRIVGINYVLNPILMVIVLVTILINCISMYLQKGIEVTNNTWIMLKISFLVAVFSFIFNIVFINNFGVYSSIIISLISQILYSFFIYKKSREVFKINISRKFIFISILIFILGFIIFEFQQSSIAYESIKLAFFTVVIIYVITSSEIKYITNDFRKK